MRVRIAVLLLLLCGPALAQLSPAREAPAGEIPVAGSRASEGERGTSNAPVPPINTEIETIHSTAPLTREELIEQSHRFVQSIMPPSFRMEGQFTKWKEPVCPRVIGLTPAAAYVVERRIREVAQQIGAQIDRRDPCPPNVRIFVSPEPQATLDELVAYDIRMFEAAPLRQLTLRYPVQSWYFGYIVDANGNALWDIDCWLYDPLHIVPECQQETRSIGNRMRTGIQPKLGVATILVDAGAIQGKTLGSLGDYLALMALAQAPAKGRCQPAPSIANLFLTNCEAGFHATALSEADLAMLKALYETPDEPELLQGIRLIGNMRRNLEGEVGK